jgi:hypothetical protein
MSRTPLRLPSPSLVVALIALVAALGGTGYAATQMRGGAGSAASTRHADAPQDAALIRQMLAKISHSYESFKFTPVAVTSTNSNSATGIGALLLPKGQYELVAKVHVFTKSGGLTAGYTPINCVLSGGGENDTARGTLENGNGDTDQTLAMIARARIQKKTNVFVACWKDDTNNTIFANALKITAIQVNRADAVPSG